MWPIILAILLVILLLYLNKCTENFSDRKVERAQIIHDKSKPVFDKGDHSYEKFKKVIPDTDSVEYTDVRDLYKRNAFTVQGIASVI